MALSRVRLPGPNLRDAFLQVWGVSLPWGGAFQNADSLAHLRPLEQSWGQELRNPQISKLTGRSGAHQSWRPALPWVRARKTQEVLLRSDDCKISEGQCHPGEKDRALLVAFREENRRPQSRRDFLTLPKNRNSSCFYKAKMRQPFSGAWLT